MKNLNNAFKEVIENKDVFYNLNHEYQPTLLDVEDFEIVDETEWLTKTEQEFRRDLATFVIEHSELLIKSSCYLGVHCKHNNIFKFSIDEDVETLDMFLDRIDYEQLRQDKLDLLEIMGETGIVSLIDCIQDMACRRGIRPEKDIFLYDEQNKVEQE